MPETTVTTAKRFSNALFIQGGACNPLAIANSLSEAIRETRAEGKTERDCPACRLIAHQLAFLLKVGELDSDLLAYGKASKDCEDMAKA